jgi:hypothetical protein
MFMYIMHIRAHATCKGACLLTGARMILHVWDSHLFMVSLCGAKHPILKTENLQKRLAGWPLWGRKPSSPR